MQEYYNIIKKIPYRRDNKPIEIIIRPFYLLKNAKIGLDCKKKTILCAAFFKRIGIPYRLKGSSQRPDFKIHHIFPEIKIGKQWIGYDATYNDNTIGQNKFYTKVEIL